MIRLKSVELPVPMYSPDPIYGAAYSPIMMSPAPRATGRIEIEYDDDGWRRLMAMVADMRNENRESAQALQQGASALPPPAIVDAEIVDE